MNDASSQRFTSEAPVNLPSNRANAEYNSDAMVELLSRLDIDYVFLLPGSSYRGLHDSLVNFGRNHKPKIVLTTHEQIAVSMAHGYAKASGRIGVCILHDLVGLMNGSMGVYNAFGDRAPVMVLGGSGPLDPADRRWIDWLHCASTQADIVKKYAKWTEEPTTAQWHLDAIAKAHKVALTAPRGPVYVTLDCGIQEQKINGTLTVPDPKYFQPAAPVAPNPDALAQAADALLNAKLPLIVGGRFGIYPEGAKPIVELVELTGAVYRDDNAIIAFPTAHPQSVSGDREIVKEADVVMAIDCRDLASLLDGYTERKENIGSGRVRAGRTVIDMSLNDISPSSWSYLRGPAPLVDVQINCDPILGMHQLSEAIKQRLAKDEAARAKVEQRKKVANERHNAVRARQRENARKGWDDTPIRPGRMVSELWEAVKDKNWLLAMRNSASFPEGIWQFPGAGSYLGANGGGGVGYGPGAMAGAAIACRDMGKFCVGLMGDGDYIMYAGAIWSAVHQRAPMLLVINNNTTWGNDEKHQMHVAEDRKRPMENAWIGQRMIDPDIDHATVARGYGAWAAGPIHDPKELAGVFKEAVAEVAKGRVAVVEVRAQLV
jgi:thiamine pyrophosphate-dependent acetolactate synthase large subunit-like protein